MSHVVSTALPPQPEVTHPFGLPLGSVRGIMSILICGFFWLLLLLPNDSPAKAVLAHFFMLGLVLMAFASAPRVERGTSPFLPWLLRLIFVGGSVAVVAIVIMTKDIDHLQTRMTPDPDEVRQWWFPFLGSLTGGFAFGLFLRFILGRSNHIFQAMRAWFSVVGILMLICELGLFFALASGAGKMDEFLHYWQSVELVIISGYFGTRA